MRRYLFDASSIINILLRGRVKPLVNGYTLDLARYETLNTVWKMARRKDGIPPEEAGELVSILMEVLSDIMRIASITGHEDRVYQLAMKENMTAYDAAYLYIAIEKGLTLVTDDKKLLQKAEKHVETMTTKEYLGED